MTLKLKRILLIDDEPGDVMSNIIWRLITQAFYKLKKANQTHWLVLKRNNILGLVVGMGGTLAWRHTSNGGGTEQ